MLHGKKFEVTHGEHYNVIVAGYLKMTGKTELDISLTEVQQLSEIASECVRITEKVLDDQEFANSMTRIIARGRKNNSWFSKVSKGFGNIISRIINGDPMKMTKKQWKSILGVTVR